MVPIYHRVVTMAATKPAAVAMSVFKQVTNMAPSRCNVMFAGRQPPSRSPTMLRSDWLIRREYILPASCLAPSTSFTHLHVLSCRRQISAAARSSSKKLHLILSQHTTRRTAQTCLNARCYPSTIRQSLIPPKSRGLRSLNDRLDLNLCPCASWHLSA